MADTLFQKFPRNCIKVSNGKCTWDGGFKKLKLIGLRKIYP